MAGDDAAQQLQQQQPAGVAEEPKLNEEEDNDDSSSSSSESEPEYDSDSSDYDYDVTAYDDGADDEEEAKVDDNSPDTNFRRFEEVIESRPYRKLVEKDDRDRVYHEDLFDFPRDPEKWREEDLRELWADAPLEITSPGWDPALADEEEWEIMGEEAKEGRDPPIAPFYLPYRKHFPAIPDNHHDISNPKSVVEELDRIEEFLKWVSYIFPDGSSYEGTVWDDLAHGKGVYVAEQGLVRYEGEWLQNEMDGHGVVEVEIPDVEPIPGSKLEAKMRAEGRIIARDFMTPEDRRWLEMDIEDSVRLAGNRVEIPFYERDEWVKVFGAKPERGRYRYAGQWKHGRMHGCGVYEVNEQIIYGRFYFGQHLEDSTGCDADVSAVHSGIAEVAAAKARMFVNKPDGMIREERGPYGDPQHPYFYEEEDAWMAPGFVNQFYEVPDYWKTYVEEIDQEREMWLNSFYKAPLRIPMPAELEYWWSKADDAEFVLINKEPEPDPEDPTKLIYTEDPVIVHTPTGRLINFVEDEEYGVRLFWQPRLEVGEDVDPKKVEFLPLGFDEFYGKAAPKKNESKLMRIVSNIENTVKPLLDRLGAWADERKKASEMNLKLIEKELDFIEAQLCLEEVLEDMETELKLNQKEEEKRAAAEEVEEENKAGTSPAATSQDEADVEDEGDDDEDDGSAPASFGTVSNEGRPSPFSSLSMSLGTSSLALMVPFRLKRSLLSWKESRLPSTICQLYHDVQSGKPSERLGLVRYPCKFSRGGNMRAMQGYRSRTRKRKEVSPQLSSLARLLSSDATRKNSVASSFKGRSVAAHNFSVLSWHVPVAI